MQLNINDPNALKLIQRLQKEIGEIYVNNCFMDEIGNNLIAENIQLRNEVITLKDKINALIIDNDILKNKLDSSRNERFDNVRTKQAKNKQKEGNF